MNDKKMNRSKYYHDYAHSQKAKVIWFTGLSGAGKTTISAKVVDILVKKGFFVRQLDGDIIRKGLNSNLSFSGEDRYENIRRIAEVSKLFIDSGIICVNSFISPTKEIRKMAKSIIGKDNYIEVFVNASLETCEKRDVKGLYEKARKGIIKNFTGIDSLFEIPENPNIEVNTEQLSVDESANKVIKYVLPYLK